MNWQDHFEAHHIYKGSDIKYFCKHCIELAKRKDIIKHARGIGVLFRFANVLEIDGRYQPVIVAPSGFIRHIKKYHPEHVKTVESVVVVKKEVIV